MTVLDRVLDFITPPPLDAGVGGRTIHPVQTCGGTYGYWFVAEDDRIDRARPLALRTRARFRSLTPDAGFTPAAF